MKAVLQSGYGTADVYSIGEVPVPVPGSGEVLVRVRATSLHADVWHVMRGVPLVLRIMGSGLHKPKNPIPGTDLAGEVVATGPGATRWKNGDEVFGQCVRSHPWTNGGAYAEFAVVREGALALKPPAVSFAQTAAAATSGLIVLDNLDCESLRPGSRVLINGAGGGVGTIAIQIAKAYGAEVTAVDEEEKLDLLRSLGADHAIDFRRADYTLQGIQYDIVFDIVGKRPFGEIQRALGPRGTYTLIGHDDYGKGGRRLLGAIPSFLGLLLRTPFIGQTITHTAAKHAEPPLEILRRLLESGQLRPAIEDVLPLEDLQPAMRRLESGAVRGKIVFAPELVP